MGEGVQLVMGLLILGVSWCECGLNSDRRAPSRRRKNNVECVLVDCFILTA